jgi:hypothetical protein
LTIDNSINCVDDKTDWLPLQIAITYYLLPITY